MSKEILLHKINDWSVVDSGDVFWGKVDLTNVESNFGLHIYNNKVWSSGYIGIGRLFDKDNNVISDDGIEHVLAVSSSYGLDPWKMLETVLLDEEYDDYINELEEEGKYLYKIFYEQQPILLEQDSGFQAELLYALSYLNACYSLCKKGLKKSLIYKETNYTAKLRGKIDVAKNIKHNTASGRTDKFYCKYIDFAEDSIENRIIKAALIKCSQVIKRRFFNDGSILNKISFCNNILRHVKHCQIKTSDYNDVVVGGLYAYYKPVIIQARGIIQHRFNDVDYENKSADKKVYTIPYSINMETLFEYYARVKLKELLKGKDYSIEKYSQHIYIQSLRKNGSVIKGTHLIPYCIPDIIVTDNRTGKPVIVIDAKYKISSRPERSDTHQLLSYVLLLGVDKCAFVFPGDKNELKKMDHEEYLFINRTDELKYYEIMLSDEDGMAEIDKIIN